MSERRALVSLLSLALIAAGCSSDEPAPPSEQGQVEVPTEVPEREATDPVSQSSRRKIAAFLQKVKFIERVGAGFDLRDVQYTSPTDAVAWFDGRKSGDTVIATTNDNWTRATQLLVPRDLSDFVTYVPLGRGAVAIKAGDEFSRGSAPPFVLYASGAVKPLQVGQPRTTDSNSDLLEIDTYDFFWAIDAPVRSLAPDDSIVLETLWAADVEAGVIFPLMGSPPGDLQESIPGRDDAVLSVDGYRGMNEVWRFNTSTDGGHTWRQTDVPLPLGRRRILPDAYASPYAIGPGDSQALAVADDGIDMPLRLRQLWRTNDEEQFRRAPLPRDRMPFAGMAFASDGALLLAEVDDTECSISSDVCTRKGRVWRMAPDVSDFNLLEGGPALFGRHGSFLLEASGGVIVAQTGYQTLAVSTDGYTWSEVTPGRPMAQP